MIDLEDALAGLVKHAPDPPDVATVTRRARQRRSRRRGVALVAVFVVVIGIGSAIALRPTDDPKRVILEQPRTESVRVTLLNGSQLEISGPESLGLTKLVPSFNAQLDLPIRLNLPYAFGHSFTVQRNVPPQLGAVFGRYPTGDGHELVFHSTPTGANGIVKYEHWTLVTPWNYDPRSWARFAEALNAHETPDGFLVIEPIAPWKVGPTDAPDVQLGGEAYGTDATFSFFITPSRYPSGCPTEAQADAHTPQGWPVSLANAASWCDPHSKVRIAVWNRALYSTAIQGLRVRRIS